MRKKYTLNLSYSIFIILSTFSSSFLAAQSLNKKVTYVDTLNTPSRKAIKIKISQDRYSNRLIPSAAIQFETRRGNLHELEFIKLLQRQNSTVIFDTLGNPAGHKRNTNLGFRFQYQFIINMVKGGAFIPQLGISMGSYYVVSKYVAQVSDPQRVDPALLTNLKHQALYNILRISPQFRFLVTRSMFIDVAMPFDIIESSLSISKRSGPSLTSNKEKGNMGLAYNFLKYNRLHFNIGIGIKIK